MFSSTTFLGTYKTEEQLSDILKQYNGGIQVSVFSKNNKKWRDLLLKITGVGRLFLTRILYFKIQFYHGEDIKNQDIAPLKIFLKNQPEK